MAFKVGDKLGPHEIVEDLLQHPDAPRDNFGYRDWDIKPGDKLGNAVAVGEDEGGEEVWIHVAGSPAGTSNHAWIKAGSPSLVVAAP